MLVIIGDNGNYAHTHEWKLLSGVAVRGAGSACSSLSSHTPGLGSGVSVTLQVSLTPQTIAPLPSDRCFTSSHPLCDHKSRFTSPAAPSAHHLSQPPHPLHHKQTQLCWPVLSMGTTGVQCSLVLPLYMPCPSYFKASPNSWMYGWARLKHACN